MLQIAGKIFGHLTAIRRIGTNKHGLAVWLCRCDCGNEHETPATRLSKGHTKSCGCDSHRFKPGHKSNVTHGHTSGKKWSPTYMTWYAMKNRCLNPKNNRFRIYGQRGIRICQRWLESFENFLADMGPRPVGKFIDRINNDGNYEPGNCRWATRSEQVQNRGKFKHSRRTIRYAKNVSKV